MAHEKLEKERLVLNVRHIQEHRVIILIVGLTLALRTSLFHLKVHVKDVHHIQLYHQITKVVIQRFVMDDLF